MNPDCSKCGARMVGPVYHAVWTECRWGDRAKPREAHLHYHCTCGYDTTRPTKDAERQPVGAPREEPPQ